MAGLNSLSDHPAAPDPETRPEHLLVDFADAVHRQFPRRILCAWGMGRTFSRFDEVDQFLRVRPGVALRWRHSLTKRTALDGETPNRSAAARFRWRDEDSTYLQSEHDPPHAGSSTVCILPATL